MKKSKFQNVIAMILTILLMVSLMPCVDGAEALYAEAAKGTPVIDGAIDDIWNSTEVITTTKWSQGSEGSTGTARILWDDKNLYLLALVKEKTFDDTNVHAWERDCVEVYMNENNNRTETYEEDDTFYRVGYKNELSGIDNVNLEGVTSSTKYTSEGYLVEVKIPFRITKPKSDTKIGIDFHVNDAISGERMSICAWSDENNVAYIMPQAFGEIKLVDKTERKPSQPIEVKITDTAVSNTSVVDTKDDTIEGASVKVDFSDKRQVMTGIGGNYAKNRMGETAIEESWGKNDPIGEYNLKNLDPKYVRVGIPIIDFEKTNDNQDSNNTNYSAFYDDKYVHQNFLLMKDFTEQKRIIIGTVWDIADWMVKNPEKRQNRYVKDDMYDELAESIAAFVKYSKDKYNIDFSYLSFNESEIGINVQFKGNEYAKIIKLTGKRLDAMGFKNIKWLAGDTGNSKGLVAFAKQQLEDQECLPYIGAISYHSWDVNDVNVTWLEKINQLAKQYNLPVWVGEVGYDPLLFQKPEFHELTESWEGASRLGINYHKAIKYTGASNLIYWQYQWDFNLLDVYGNIFPSFYIVRQLNETLLPGMTVVNADSDNDYVRSLAAYNKGQMTVNIWNNSTKEGNVTVKNIPNGSYGIISSSEKGEYDEKGKVVAEKNQATVLMPKKSMVTLILKVTGNEITDFAGSPVKAADPSTVGASSGEQGIKININGKRLIVDEEPFMNNDRIQVPLRSIFEGLGATVKWVDSEQKVIATKGDATITLVVNNTNATMNGKPVVLDSPPLKPNDRVFVPVRFVSEALGTKVIWNAAINAVDITDENSTAAYNNIVLNSGFENDATEWELNAGAGVIEITSSEKHTGNKALKINSTGNTKWNGVLQQMPVDKNSKYKLSLWTKGDDVGSAFNVKGINHVYLLKGENIYNKPSKEWKETTMEFNTGESDVISIHIFDEGVPGTVYYDDISITKVN